MHALYALNFLLFRVREDKDEGKLESVEKMMETGIFWATVKCPKCARNQTVQTTFFYNKCKMCRNVSFIFILKWDASSRWSFGPNSARGSIETINIGKMQPTLIQSSFLEIGLADESVHFVSELDDKDSLR